MKLPRATLAVALGSAASLAAQALFSLVMLRWFTPQAVGTFSVVAQIAFFWMTLALAQSPLTLLADAHVPARPALRSALAASLRRMLWLAPAVVAAVAWSRLPSPAWALAWACGLALLQGGWYLAQPYALRTRSPQAAALAKAAPPVTALAVATLAALAWPGAPVAGLLCAALAGYAAGALWLLPPRRAAEGGPGAEAARGTGGPAAAPAGTQRDGRSMRLRMAHTAVDALTGAGLLIVWQRTHGAADAGYLAVLLRLLGFVPVVVHASWAQVLLAGGSGQAGSPLRVGLAGAVATLALGTAGAAALAAGLAPSWQAALPYVAPLALWQAAACVHAACSHLPFQQGRATAFSRTAIAVALLQWALLALPAWWPGAPIAAVAHAWCLGAASAAALLAWALWMAGLGKGGRQT